MPLIYFLPTIACLIGGAIIGAVVVYGSGGREGNDFSRIFFWGAAIGGICFIAGFVGPVYIGPESPQGPLLGIFISGPAGALLGCAVGVTRSIRIVRARGAPKT
jgi:hypothetical protein